MLVVLARIEPTIRMEKALPPQPPPKTLPPPLLVCRSSSRPRRPTMAMGVAPERDTQELLATGRMLWTEPLLGQGCWWWWWWVMDTLRLVQ